MAGTLEGPASNRADGADVRVCLRDNVLLGLATGLKSSMGRNDSIDEDLLRKTWGIGAGAMECRGGDLGRLSGTGAGAIVATGPDAGVGTDGGGGGGRD